jgi:hypothetical protein
MGRIMKATYLNAIVVFAENRHPETLNHVHRF